MSGGNTVGKITGTPAAPSVPARDANPPAKAETAAEASTGAKVLDGIQLGLDVVGLIPGVGEVADLANAGISAARGDFIGAGLSLASAIPFAGWGATAAKAGRKGAQAAEAATKVAKEKAAREAAERAAKEKAEREAAEKAQREAAEANKPKPQGDGKKTKPKKKMKCGEYGKYGDLKKKTGEGKFDRDHIPSKAALKKQAQTLNKGKQLTRAQEKAIDNFGNAIAIPRQAHIDISPTYGQSAAAAAQDAKDLAGSARRDVEEMLKKIDEYDADGNCKKAYQKASKRVLRMSNEDYDKVLKDLIKQNR